MLNVSNLSKNQSGETLYSSCSFQINPGEKVGLVGPNGSGKTTLFRMIIGEEKPDEGQISFPDKLRWAYFSQKVGEMKGKTALQEVIEGDAKIKELQEKLREFEEKLADMANMTDDEMNDVLMKMGDVQSEFEKRGGYDLESRAEEILTGLGIMPEDHHKKVEDFSGGWKMRIALAKVLVINPEMIIMDEPTNYLDMETILWLENWLKNYKGAIFMTTHDRDFMNNVCKKIIEISHGKMTTYSGNYDWYLQERETRLVQLKAQAQRQADMLAKEEEFIAKFKARASHAAQVQSRVKKLDKIDRIEVPTEEETINFQFPTPPRGGDDVIMLEDLAKAWTNSKGENIPVFSGLKATVKRLDKIAVVGVNGAGKSTLLKCITQHTEPTSGQVKVGPSIKIGYFSQYSLDVLEPENSVFDEVRKGLGEASDGYVRNLLAAFLFRGNDVDKKVKYLSGGEKSRLVMAVLLSQNNNCLILDEPTNHLDIKSREVLLEALKAYEGTILFVSHDRHFLTELSAKVFEVDHGQVLIYPGNYKYYCDKKAGLIN
ncbi:ABC-F family ATP-binding cassette domain-containing protein [Bacteriovorax sp. Seq25_V]|uniref:ABC-F family ATP-binding cassette domain-containing protein n=1 Tax=Bacteriovorax sp. Seq25_V TaxID=1201288 RepID=UPI00038A1E2C|nr:ABC-F family ATP-binding cassette domain-containing protein [Bacteriovorax sp. Seq25_V]EQC45726.1 ABC transporter, ATP-binding protein [Bacteriovorax sp. Seq25_V]